MSITMAYTFSQIYIQLVFAVKGRDSLIMPIWEEELYKYITGIVTNKGQKMLAINGMPDHIHLLVGIKPSCSSSDLVREIKKSTNEWINAKVQKTEAKLIWIKATLCLRRDQLIHRFPLQRRILCNEFL